MKMRANTQLRMEMKKKKKEQKWALRKDHILFKAKLAMCKSVPIKATSPLLSLTYRHSCQHWYTHHQTVIEITK